MFEEEKKALLDLVEDKLKEARYRLKLNRKGIYFQYYQDEEKKWVSILTKLERLLTNVDLG